MWKRCARAFKRFRASSTRYTRKAHLMRCLYLTRTQSAFIDEYPGPVQPTRTDAEAKHIPARLHSALLYYMFIGWRRYFTSAPASERWSQKPKTENQTNARRCVCVFTIMLRKGIFRPGAMRSKLSVCVCVFLSVCTSYFFFMMSLCVGRSRNGGAHLCL